MKRSWRIVAHCGGWFFRSQQMRTGWMKLNRCAVQRDGDIDCLDGPFVADLFVADRSAGRHALKCNRFDRRSDRPLFSPVGVLSGVPIRSTERSTTLLAGRGSVRGSGSIGGAIDHSSRRSECCCLYSFDRRSDRPPWEPATNSNASRCHPDHAAARDRSCSAGFIRLVRHSSMD